LDVVTISLAFVAVIGITMGFEAVAEGITHYTNEWASEIHAKVVTDVVTKLYRELTILGFISFTLMMVLQSQVLGAASNEVHAFEFAHVTTFFIALLFILQTVIFIWTTHSIKARIFSFAPTATDRREYRAQKQQKLGRLQRYFERFQHTTFFTHSRAFDEMCHYILRASFLSEYHLPAQFNFRLYVCKGLDTYMVHLMDPSLRSWGFLLCFVFFNILRHTYVNLGHLGEYLFFLSLGWVLLLAMCMVYLRTHELKVDVVCASSDLKNPRPLYRLLLDTLFCCCCKNPERAGESDPGTTNGWSGLWNALDRKQEAVFALQKNTASTVHTSETTFDDRLSSSPGPTNGAAGSAIRQRHVMRLYQRSDETMSTSHLGLRRNDSVSEGGSKPATRVIDVEYEAGLYAVESRIQTWRMRQRVKSKTKTSSRRRSLQQIGEALAGGGTNRKTITLNSQKVALGRAQTFKTVLSTMKAKARLLPGSTPRSQRRQPFLLGVRASVDTKTGSMTSSSRPSYLRTLSRSASRGSRHVVPGTVGTIGDVLQHGPEAFAVGARVVITKEGSSFKGAAAVVIDTNWGGRLKVKMQGEGMVKSMQGEGMVKMQGEGMVKSYLPAELKVVRGSSGGSDILRSMRDATSFAEEKQPDSRKHSKLGASRESYDCLSKWQMFQILLKECDQLSFLNELDESQQRELSEQLTPMTFADGEMLVREDDEITSFSCCYIVREGALIIRQQSQIVAIRKAGQFIGEQALISNSKRTADCIAKGEVKVLAMKMSAFASFMKPFWGRMGNRAKAYERFNFDLQLMPTRKLTRINYLHAWLELLILLNGTYLSIIFAFFIPNISVYVEGSLKAVTAILMIFPSAISICLLSPPLLRDLSLLHFYSAIDVGVMEEVVQQEIALLRIQEWVIGTLQYAMEREEGDGIEGADRLFTQFDHDETRSLSKAELQRGLETLNIFLPRKDFETFFRLLDTEQTGRITFEQFLGLLQISHKTLTPASARRHMSNTMLLTPKQPKQSSVDLGPKQSLLRMQLTETQLAEKNQLATGSAEETKGAKSDSEEPRPAAQDSPTTSPLFGPSELAAAKEDTHMKLAAAAKETAGVELDAAPGVANTCDEETERTRKRPRNGKAKAKIIPEVDVVPSAEDKTTCR
jgi:hypothetical protein